MSEHPKDPKEEEKEDEIENRYYDFVDRRLAQYGVKGEELSRLFGAVMSDLHPAPKQGCHCGKSVVFSMHSREFECSRCGQKWQLVMEIKPIPKKTPTE